MTVPWRLIGVLALVLAGFGSAWQFQDWRYGNQLADQARLHAEDFNQLTQAAAVAQQAERDKRLALEQKLSTSEQTHYKELSDAERTQARLRDRLVTADVRLSALLDSDSTGGCDMAKPPPPAAWIMQPYAPDLTQRMLNELSPSPMKAIED